jgi:putative protease
MNKLEILAPVGSPESLLPAVRLGADAVYLGAKQFSARGNAGNFDRDALKDAVEYCHVRGVRVYLALNTLVRDSELPKAMELVDYAASLPVDALIVQDAGLASLVRRACPGMRLHGSTQMSVHTPLGAKRLYDAGFSRVVLSRELSLTEIEEIAASSPIELEVFVHGALCMSVSGQCYLSAALGGRSGNRGLCAQPCRLPFSAPGGTGHDLSLKDCCNLDHLRRLAEIGVCSAKIEGRMKRPEYVAAAVAACRAALKEGSVPKEQMEPLAAVFSRSGFTDGYLTGKRGRALFGTRQKEDVAAATGEVLANLRAGYKDEPARIPVDFTVAIRPDQPAEVSARDGEGNQARVFGELPQPAQRVAVTPEKCQEQLGKTGGTPYALRECAAAVAPGLALPASALNRLRREALSELSAQRAFRPAHKFSPVSMETVENHRTCGDPNIRARFPHTRIPQAFRNCELVYVPLHTTGSELKRLLGEGFPVALEIPRGMFGREREVLAALESAKKLGITHAWAGTLGAVAAAAQAGMTVHGGFGLNLFNTAALEQAQEWGLADAELSMELSLSQAARLGGTLPRGVMVYGRMPLMLTRNCPAANAPGGCQGCKRPPALTDRMGVAFPMQCSGGCTEMLNSVPTVLWDRKREIQGMDFVILRFSVENPVESEEKLLSFHKGDRPEFGFTRGLSDRGVE